MKGRLFGRFGRQGVGLVFIQVITVIAGIGVGALLARGLGVEGYGQYVFALTIVQVMMIPLDFGLPTLVMREVAILRARADWPLLNGLLRLIGAFVAMVFAALVIALLAWYFLTDRVSGLYLAALVLAGIWSNLRLASAVLRGMERVVLAAIPDQVIRPLTMLAALALISLFGRLSPASAMALHAVAAAVGLAWTAWMLRFRAQPIPVEWNGRKRYSARTWLRSTLVLSLGMGADFIKQRSDVMMLGILADSRQVGLYGFAVLIGGIASMSQNLMNQMIAPRFAAAYANNEFFEIERLSRLSAACVMAACLCVMLALYVLGAETIDAVIGAEFSGALPLALIIAAGPTLASAFGPVALIHNMTGNEAITAKQTWIWATVNIGMNVILIPLVGVYGAALATATTQLAQRIVLWRSVRVIIGINSAVFPQVTQRKPYG